MRRAIENVEIACGMPILMQGYNSEDIARGIDEMMIRQPVGVCAAICPFNFPGMIPFWFMPYALACGNTYIVKPSEKVPLTMQRIFGLIEQTGVPRGVVNLVNGAAEAVDAILDHPAIRAISFVGSTPVARYVYRRAAEQRQACPVPGRGEEPARDHAGRRPGDDDANHGRQRLRLRRAALPGGLAGHHRRRGARLVPRDDLRCRRKPGDRLRAGRGRADGTGDHRRRARSGSRG